MLCHFSGVCLPGYNKQFGTGNCVLCSTGTFKNSTGNHPCQSCPPGMYSTMEGQTDDSNCVNCSGTVVDNLNGGIDCDMFNSTKFKFYPYWKTDNFCNFVIYNNKFLFIAVCGPGLYQYQEQCKPCPAGFYKDTEGNTYCTSCEEGTTTETSGATSRYHCSTLYYLYRKSVVLV